VIECVQCEHPNPDGALSCAECGAVLVGAGSWQSDMGVPEDAAPGDEDAVGTTPAQEDDGGSDGDAPGRSADAPSHGASASEGHDAPAAESAVPQGIPVGRASTGQSSSTGDVPAGIPVGVPPSGEQPTVEAPEAPDDGEVFSGITDVMPQPEGTAGATEGVKIKPPSEALREKAADGAEAPSGIEGISPELLEVEGGASVVERRPQPSTVRRMTLDERISAHPPTERRARGDAALEEGDYAEALAWYEATLQDNMRDTALLEKMIDVAEKAGDPVRLSRCLATMAQLSADPATRADYLIRAAQVTRTGRKQPEKAAAGLLAALEHDPSRLDAFLELTEIHTETEDWTALGEAYRFMIHKHSNPPGGGSPPRKLLSKLWRKQGALLAERLGFPDEGVTAVRSAMRLDPDDVKNAATLYDIATANDELDVRIEAMSAIVDLVTDAREQVDDVRTLGELYLEAGNRDAGYCCFRLLDHLGETNEHEATFVDKLRPRVGAATRTPSTALTPELWAQVYPDELPLDVGKVFGLLAFAVADRLENEPRTFGLRPGDRLDKDAPVLLNTLMTRVATLLGIEDQPDVWISEADDGPAQNAPHALVNAVFDPPGFVVDKTRLSEQAPAQLAFQVGRLMALQKPAFYLPSICPINDLKVYVMGATKWVRPDAPVPESKDIEWIIKRIERRLTEAQQSALRGTLGDLIDRGAVIDVEDYLY